MHVSLRRGAIYLYQYLPVYITCHKASRGVGNRDVGLGVIDGGLLPRYRAYPQSARCQGSDRAIGTSKGQARCQERRLLLELLDSCSHQARPPRRPAHIEPRSVHTLEEYQALETVGSAYGLASPALVAVRPWQCKNDSFCQTESPASRGFHLCSLLSSATSPRAIEEMGRGLAHQKIKPSTSAA
jgi:hypothetical protein